MMRLEQEPEQQMQMRRDRATLAVSALAIIVIGALEAYALAHGINGAGMSLAFAAIAGLGGFTLRDVLPRGGK